jgi:predicted amidohydrolase
MNELSVVTVAAVQYNVEFLHSWAAYERKLTRLVAAAAEQGAQWVLFPEYACLELASIFPAEVYSVLHKHLDALQECVDDYLQLHRKLARCYGLYVVAGSFPLRLADGNYRNRAWLCRPDGSYDYQDKLIMTRYENEEWIIQPGDEIKVFTTPWGPVGIAICYDSEFPLIARQQVERGAKLILVPSCTDTYAGYNRVRIGCQARALENQCYVVMSPIVGQIDWSAAQEIYIGAAGIYTPPDVGFPGNGVLVQGELNADQTIIATLELSKVDHVREYGQVLNHRDWELQVRNTEYGVRNGQVHQPLFSTLPAG